MKLPPALPVLHQAFQASGYDVRLVGGCVRDLHLGQTPKDYDLCTDAQPEEMMALAKRAGLRVVPTGLQHGTVSFILDHTAYEITTLRLDVACDGRHAEVAFTRNWQKDAARRDLTINAMMQDFDGRVYDWFGGREDLAARAVRFVGRPDARIQEDYLRILRFYRFATKFPDDPARPVTFDPEGMAATARQADGLRRISVERVWSEVRQILAKPQGAALLPVLKETRVADVIGLPVTYERDAVAVARAGASPLAVLATQLPNPGAARTLAERWKMSTAERDQLTFLARERGRATTERLEDCIADNVPRDWVVDLARLTGLDAERIRNFPTPVFPVRGEDLIARGYTPGPDFGRTLRTLRQAWMASRFTLDRDRLLEPLDRTPRGTTMGRVSFDRDR